MLNNVLHLWSIYYWLSIPPVLDYCCMFPRWLLTYVSSVSSFFALLVWSMSAVFPGPFVLPFLFSAPSNLVCPASPHPLRPAPPSLICPAPPNLVCPAPPRPLRPATPSLVCPAPPHLFYPATPSLLSC